MQIKKRATIYIIAGEVSGDAMGAKLMAELKPAIFYGIGGSQMSTAGLSSLFDYDELALMGFVEIIPRIFHLRKLIDDTVTDIISKNPDVLITIDSPGFTYRVAKRVRELRPAMKMIHMVAPSVWAYKPDRAAKYADVYDHLLTLFPFEPPYFTTEGLASTCIGHPIFEQKFGGGDTFRKSHQILKNTKVVVVTPGSRRAEITRHLPIFLDALELVRNKYPNLIAVFALSGHEELASRIINNRGIIVSGNERFAAYAAADVALAKSGTNTLEIAASGTPMIVGYKLNPLTFWTIKLMAKIKYASLINIVEDRMIIPEYLQGQCVREGLSHGLLEILNNPQVGKDQVAASKIALKKMGFGSIASPSAEAAQVIRRYL